MKKRIFGILLVLVLASTAFMSVCASPAAVEVEAAEENAFESTSENDAELSSLPKLPKPTNLKWNEDWSERSQDRSAFYGFASWDWVSEAEGEYIIALYCDGEFVGSNYIMRYDDDGNGRVGWSFAEDDVFVKSGKYVFKVCARGDRNKYADSDYAVSAEFDFIMPSAVLDTPKNVKWDGNRITHTSVENASDYIYFVYNQRKEVVLSIVGSGKYPLTNQPEITGFDMSIFINNIIPNNYPDIKKMYVAVKAVTYDITKYGSSEKSAMSDAKVLVEHEEDMTSSLENALSGVENGNITAEEALDNFKNFMEDSGSTNVELALNMMKDENVANNIDTLEEKFIEQTGVAVDVKSTASDENYLSDRGIDVNEITIKGAALNSKDGEDVSLTFSEAEEGISADPKYYKNSVAVNIGMTGVENSQKLDVPVIIEMPIPAGVVPHRLFILHYHVDGSVEQIQPAIIYDGGKTKARFILTSFSTFIFCNAEDVIPGNVYTDDEVTVEDANLTIKDLIALAQYVSGNKTDLTTAQLTAANVYDGDDIDGATVDVNINEKDIEELADMLV